MFDPLNSLFASIPLIALVIVVVFILLSGIVIVQQQYVAIVERFGKFNRIMHAGLNFRIPIVERVSKASLMTLNEDISLNAKTSDNVTIGVTVAVQYRINADMEPGLPVEQQGIYLSQYTLADPVDQMRSYFADALRSQIPNYTLDQVFGEKDAIADAVYAAVSEKMLAYGYAVIRTLITDIALPEDVRQAMNRNVATEKEKISATNEAEAAKTRMVTQARAEAESSTARGEGIANMRKAIAMGIKESLDVIKESGVTAEEANELFMYTQYLDTLSDFAKKSTTTIMLPSDFRETRSMFEQMVSAGSVTVDKLAVEE